jgi:predicted transcriptional regulator
MHILRAAGMSARQIGEQLGVKPSLVRSHWSKPKAETCPSFLSDIAEALNQAAEGNVNAAAAWLRGAASQLENGGAS